MIHKRYRIVSTPRFLTFFVIVILSAIFVFNTLAGAYESQSLSRVQYKEVTVQSGDTLWEIASENCRTEDGNGVDIRLAVDEICRENNISASQIKVGDIIKVPQVI
ncbi:MAG: LysM peptidoglycan-binding domain-containing protein [Clostridia bacterium]|nr:LysM peptidoglycan-binding domain-containing protein [Clostridia bacterium]